MGHKHKLDYSYDENGDMEYAYICSLCKMKFPVKDFNSFYRESNNKDNFERLVNKLS